MILFDREEIIIRSLCHKFFWFSIFGISRANKNKYDYAEWINKAESTVCEGPLRRKNTEEAIQLIILVHTSEQQNGLIIDSINSVINQSVPNWELLVVVDDTTQLTSVCKDKRIKLFPKTAGSSFFESVNSVAFEVSGDLITFISQGDLLSKYAVEYVTNCINAQLIVTDEDSLDVSGRRCNPFFKPDWNPDYLANYNYFSKAVIYDRKLFARLGGFNCKANDPCHDLALRATTQLNNCQIVHISKILFHFNQYTNDKIYRIQFEVPEPTPLVTVIIPTKDQLELLEACIDGLLNKTKYENIEIIVIDNQSQHSETLEYLIELENNQNIRVLKYEKAFNYSEMNNLAAKEAKGSLLCFLNNDVSMIEDDWLTEMVSQACRSEIGCVGAKLFYPDGTIQHAGVILGLKGYASHAHKGFAGDAIGYFNRLQVAHNVSAVTAACMVVRKEVFESVGGFDGVNLKVAYNDVDLCLKVREAGYRNLFTPYAQLVHHESKSRGKTRSKSQQKELRKESKYLVKKWGEVLTSDPAYNKNLTLLREDFSLGFDRVDL